MRRWVWLALVGLIALATRPFWSLPQFFYTDDGLLHLLRVFALDRTLSQGVIYPRSLVDLAWGMGYTIFDFYPPLSAYLTEALHVLGFDFAAAIQATFVLIIAFAVCGAYAMGFEFYSNEMARFLTASVYVFFPYFLIDIFIRGAIAEALAAAILPWLVWAWQRALTRANIGAWLLAAVFLTITLLAHSLTLFMVAPFLIAFGLGRIFQFPALQRFRVSMQAIGAALLGVGLGAFYWLPFVAELSLVRMGRGVPAIPAQLPFHLLEPTSLVQSTWLYRYGVAPFELGRVPVALGLLAFVITLFAKRFQQRGLVIPFGAMALIAACLMITPVRDLWLTVPAATMIQYTWRLSLLIGLALAICVGSLPSTLSSFLPERSRNSAYFLVLIVVSIGIIYSALGDFVPQPLTFPSNELTIAQLARFEEYSGFIGTTTWGEYLPTTFQPTRLADYHAPAQIRSNADVSVSRYDAARRELTINTTTSISISLRALYFPDWRATIDDQPVPIYASSPMGLVTVDVPVGNHRVFFFQGDTIPRQVGGTISILCLGVLLILFGRVIRRRDPDGRSLAIVLATLFLIAALPTSIALSATPLPIQSTQVQVSSALRLIGVRVESAQLQNDIWRISSSPNVLRLQANWHVQQTLADKPFTWRLADASGKVVASGTQRARYGSGYPTSWLPNEIVDDWFDIPLDGVLTGHYSLQAAFDTGDFSDVSQIEFAQSIVASTPPLIPHRVETQIGNSIHLLGDDAPVIARPGERLPFSLFWQASQLVNDDYTVFAQLLDAHDDAVTRLDTIPGGGLAPTFLWLPGKIVKDQRELNLPSNVYPGLYHIVVGMYRYPNLNRLPVIVDGERTPDDVAMVGEVKIIGNSSPAPSHVVDATLDSAIRLRGYDFTLTRDRAALTLYWQAHAKVEQDYKVFVHILGADGQIVAQQDRVPDDGRYPTHIWDNGETIVDAYSFSNFPPGQYQVVVGIYAPDSGERLLALDVNGRALAERQIPVTSFEWTNH